jgi:hypothetical protein
VLNRVRAEQTPVSSPVMAGVPEMSPSHSSIFASPQMQGVISPGAASSHMVYQLMAINIFKVSDKNILQSSPDVIATKVHDPRMTVSQDMPKPKRRRQTLSQDPIMESAMAQNTINRHDALCDSPHCTFCVRIRAEDESSVHVSVGPYDPQFEADFDQLLLVCSELMQFRIIYNGLIFHSTVAKPI